LCSFMNRCYATPTTGNDTNFINTNSTEQSLLTTSGREWAQLMAEFGSNTTLWSSRLDQLIDLIEAIGRGSPQASVRNFLNESIPIAKFFDSNESAVEFIKVLTDADTDFAQNLLNASITPLFALKAYQEELAFSNRNGQYAVR
uniref:ERAP1_C domain-containing protein n=1 Tax=Anisakis simplex TaxID=6269 RepID=A0A0M3KI53_ANISI